MHLSRSSPVLTKWKYQIRYDIVSKHIHWLLLKEYGIPVESEWYSHVLNVLTERDDVKITIYWDKSIKTDRKVSYNRPDVVAIDRDENTWYIVDFAIPMNHHVKKMEKDKIDKYMNLVAYARRHFRVKTVIVPIVSGTSETVPAKLSELLEKLETEDIIGSLQTAILIFTTAMVKRVLIL